ncbi:cytochrome oxidase assembly protein-domain-containing protein [Limtongia smithiae]|uniref:cytochrome oxidase assembly protein-domain-containing protein n=1 Tax=Limtongia smithiae TaxID=1125753 RepID=UPI0034CE3DA9
MSRKLARPALFFLHNSSVKSCLPCELKSLLTVRPPPSRSTRSSSLLPFDLAGMLRSRTAGLPMFLSRSSGSSGSGREMSTLARRLHVYTRVPSPSLATGTRVFSATARAPEAEKQLGEFAFMLEPKRVLTERSVGIWLVISGALVFGIVVIGGLTRLTESGLSITEWKPVTGMIPPLSTSDWETEFEKYKQSPEYKLLNSNMTLSEFKFIFFMEWSHRLWGRAIGLFLVIPGAYFIFRGRTSARVTRRILGIAGLVGFQGFIGWWMVKSGLSDHFLDEGVDGKYKDNHPRVSQYRLAAHLGLAFIVYLSMLWTGLEVLKEARFAKDPKFAVETIAQLRNPRLRFYKFAAVALLGLVFTTAMSGAFVAGLDAGLIYNEFPFMGEGLIPPKADLFTTFYTRKADDSDLIWRNMLENPVTVQLTHRIFATTSFTAIVLFHIYSTKLNKANLLPRAVFRASHGVIGLVALQVTLGITTLLYLVPVPLAAAHQAGSLALLTEVLVLCMRLRRPRATIATLLRSASSATAGKKRL